MRTIIQRVSHAKVEVEGKVIGQIEAGLLILLGITHADTDQDIDWLVKKIPNLRIFNDAEDKMNLSVTDIGGEMLVISQFTLYADAKKGNRPSYIRSAPPDFSIPMYEKFLTRMREAFPGKVAEGEFGADMKVALINDGPVTIVIDSHNKE